MARPTKVAPARTARIVAKVRCGAYCSPAVINGKHAAHRNMAKTILVMTVGDIEISFPSQKWQELQKFSDVPTQGRSKKTLRQPKPYAFLGIRPLARVPKDRACAYPTAKPPTIRSPEAPEKV
ncbi:hypothetical protein [Roseovarius sp. 217]|uniref:hypothetical protein n=1 Tax=Roseovarius sp. (strain 217) TaxID=314264 RepID=UPI0020C783EB|nr:hypothetical protein [Roseovarius sp. 217]